MREYIVRVTPAAISDIEELANFYLELVDEESAARFSADVLETIESLDTFPEGNAYFDEKHGLRRALLKHHKVSVVYLVDGNVYEVIAFGAFHTSGRPNKYTKELIKRLKELR